MDALKAQHLFDVIEQGLSDIKSDVLSNSENGSTYFDLEERVDELEGEIEDLKEDVERKSDQIDDHRDAHKKVISDLESYLKNIINDHPCYSTDGLENAIQKLKNLL